MSAHNLKNFNILIVDADTRLANVTRNMLIGMGFSNINVTPNGAQAFEMLHVKPIDFMITEWNTREIDGLSLLNRIRRDRESPDQTLPVVMLTGRAEKEDVITARDYGINEYIIKPFSAKTLYSRLERLIETPRLFVLSHYYIGPDRRLRTIARQGEPERRQAILKAQPKPEGAAAAPTDADLARLWLPDDKLRRKLGKDVPLSKVITAARIEEAQQAIETVNEQSTEWLQENLAQLRTLQERVTSGDHYTLLPMDMSETALLICSRAGTFGYRSASKIAYMLYLFCRNSLRVDRKEHQMVSATYLSALRAMLDRPRSSANSAKDNEIVVELRNLALRFAA